MRALARALRPALALGVLLLCAPAARPGAATPPRSETIALDGDVADWALVLGNPANASRDGAGSSGACATSTDRDCPVASDHEDLVRFAWTWDDSGIFLYFERADDRGSPTLAWTYLDVDHDGLMRSGEPVVQVDMEAGALSLLRYYQSAPGGDPLEDAAGWADGYDMPGFGGFPVVDLGSAAIGDARFVEAGVAWGALGLPPGAALGYHVATGSGFCAAPNVTDNVGGPDGRAGSTAWRTLRFVPGARDGAAPIGGSASLAHVLVNDGNVAAAPLLDLGTSCRAAVEIWRDDDGDGAGDVRLCRDAEGDDDLGGPADSLDPAGDPDADGRLDVGLLQPGSSLALVVVIQPQSGCASLRLDLVATDSGDASSRATVSDIVRVGTVTLEPDVSVIAVAGDDAHCAHVLRNNVAAAARIDVAVLSSFSWPWELREDSDANGDPAGEPVLTDTDGSGAPDVLVPAAGFVRLLASVRVPATAPVGFVEDAVIRAAQGASVLASVADRVTVRRAVDLGPNYLQVEGREHRGPSGGSVWFAHRLVNAFSTDETFVLSASSPDGWPVSFFSDPDRDGRPFDAAPMGATTPAIPGNGGGLDFLVRIDLPASEVPPASTLVTVDAASVTMPSASDSAWDEAVAAIVTTWEDAAHGASLVEATPCATVHALATGVPSASDVRFEWRDAAGTTRRAVLIASDSQGRAADAHVLGTGELGADLSIEVQASDGTPLDRAIFDVVDPLVVESLASERPAWPLVSTVRASLVLANGSFLLEPRDVRVHALVLSPDRSSYMDGGGTFQPWSGVEWTAGQDVPIMRREERLALAYALPAQFPAEGTYALETWLEASCGPARWAASTTLDAIADADGDGLRDADEIAAGTSPADADSDDDGLPDGEDGLGDADADGVIDALDCDSDDDGLQDGLEAGVAAPGPDTDSSRGCFAADGDPSSTSDPDLADTDGGGLPDGAEDRDRDGVRDAGDKDLRDPADDAAGCLPDPPPDTSDLRVSHAAGSALLSWQASADACVGHDVFVAESLPSWRMVAGLAWTTPHRDDTTLAPASLRFYEVRPRSALGPP